MYPAAPAGSSYYAGFAIFDPFVPPTTPVTPDEILREPGIEKNYRVICAWQRDLTQLMNAAGTRLCTAAASFEDTGYPASNVISGSDVHYNPTVDLDNNWWGATSPSGGSLPWVSVNFATPVTFNMVIVYLHPLLPTCGFFTLEKSNDGVTWEIFYSAENSPTKVEVDTGDPITTSHVRLVAESYGSDGTVRVVSIKLYNWVDESERVDGNDTGDPQITITMKSDNTQNAVPTPSESSIVLINDDARFSVANTSSEIYGILQPDGLGSGVKSGTPVRIYASATDEEGNTFESLAYDGFITADDNAAGSTGITYDDVQNSATIICKSLYSLLGRTNINPPVYESAPLDYVIKDICYRCGIADQDINVSFISQGVPYTCYNSQPGAAILNDILGSLPFLRAYETFAAGAKMNFVNYGRGRTDSDLSRYSASPPGTSWSKVTASPGWSARTMWNGGGVVFNNRIWVLGGIDTGSVSQIDTWSSADGVNWVRETLAGYVGTQQGPAICTFVSPYTGVDTMFVFGGFFSGAGTEAITSWSTDGKLWFNTGIGINAPPWVGRNRQMAISFNGGVYVMGGRTADAGDTTLALLNDVWFSRNGVLRSTWSQLTAAAGWAARRSAGICVFAGKLWILGGTNESSYYNDVWNSDDGISWTQVTSAAAWSPRASHNVIVFNGLMWVIGGGNGGGLNNEVWYSADGSTWTRSNNIGVAITISQAAGCAMGSNMYIYGGNSSGAATANSNVWKSYQDSIAEFTIPPDDNGKLLYLTSVGNGSNFDLTLYLWDVTKPISTGVTLVNTWTTPGLPTCMMAADGTAFILVNSTFYSVEYDDTSPALTTRGTATNPIVAAELSGQFMWFAQVDSSNNYTLCVWDTTLGFSTRKTLNPTSTVPILAIGADDTRVLVQSTSGFYFWNHNGNPYGTASWTGPLSFFSGTIIGGEDYSDAQYWYNTDGKLYAYVSILQVDGLRREELWAASFPGLVGAKLCTIKEATLATTNAIFGKDNYIWVTDSEGSTWVTNTDVLTPFLVGFSSQNAIAPPQILSDGFNAIGSGTMFQDSLNRVWLQKFNTNGNFTAELVGFKAQNEALFSALPAIDIDLMDGNTIDMLTAYGNPKANIVQLQINLFDLTPAVGAVWTLPPQGAIFPSNSVTTLPIPVTGGSLRGYGTQDPSTRRFLVLNHVAQSISAGGLTTTVTVSNTNGVINGVTKVVLLGGTPEMRVVQSSTSTTLTFAAVNGTTHTSVVWGDDVIYDDPGTTVNASAGGRTYPMVFFGYGDTCFLTVDASALAALTLTTAAIYSVTVAQSGAALIAQDQQSVISQRMYQGKFVLPVNSQVINDQSFGQDLLLAFQFQRAYTQPINMPWYPIMVLAQPLSITNVKQSIVASLNESVSVQHQGFETSVTAKQWLPQFNI